MGHSTKAGPRNELRGWLMTISVLPDLTELLKSDVASEKVIMHRFRRRNLTMFQNLKIKLIMMDLNFNT